MSCSSPIYINVRGVDIPAPCRRCASCRASRRMELSMRYRFEMADNYRLGYGSCFGTLTYNEENYPGGIRKKDVVDFNKRLRYYIKSNPSLGVNPNYKYLIVSELGSLNDRAHYHFIYTGISSTFMDSYLRKSWKLGFTQCDFLTVGRINYCLKYMDKQQFPYKNLCKDKNDVHYGLYYDEESSRWLEAPFTLISKGVGANYLFKNRHLAYNDGTINNGGSFIPYPKYYGKKFGLDTESLSGIRYAKLKQLAAREGLSVTEYQLCRSIAKEKMLIAKGRNHGNAMDDYGLKNAEAFHKTVVNRSKSSNTVNNILKEIENET